eukprot:scaffold30445_cov54-Phaeocystis_antarctica.AAC.2
MDPNPSPSPSPKMTPNPNQALERGIACTPGYMHFISTAVVNVRQIRFFKATCSMVKVPPWQCPSSAPVPPQGVPGGSGQLGTPMQRSAHCAPRHCLGCSSQPPPKPPIPPPLTLQATCKTDKKFHFTVGHTTVMGTATFFGPPKIETDEVPTAEAKALGPNPSPNSNP